MLLQVLQTVVAWSHTHHAIERSVERLAVSKTYHITHLLHAQILIALVNQNTHSLVDSILIYKIFGVMFLKYVFSSLSSCVIDLILFAFFCKLLRGGGGSWYVMAATVAARVISAVYNYLINYRFVFRSNKSYSGSAMRYATLAIIQMCASALLVTGGVMLFRGVSETLIKVVVDGCLFFISYYVQRKVVF